MRRRPSPKARHPVRTPVIALVCLALLTAGLLLPGAGPARAAEPCGPFDDVPTNIPHCKNIKWLSDEGITEGMSKRKFAPTKPASREAIIAFLYRIKHPGEPEPTCTSAPFPDVPTDYKFCGHISWAKTEGLTDGYSDGTFRPRNPVSREASAAFLYRYATDRAPRPNCSSSPFQDVPTGHEFCGYIQWLKEKQITGGMDGCVYGMKKRTSRAAMATFLKRVVIPEPVDQECRPKPTRPTKQALFSYGTLMKGQPAAHYLNGTYASYARSSLKGADLYYSSSRAFPYAVIGGSNTVQGEVYNLHNSTANATIKKTDAYERYNPAKPATGQAYVRKQYTIKQGYTAWVYVAGPQQAAWLKSNGTRIPSGDWLRR